MTSTIDESNKEKMRSVSVDLNHDASLLIDIPDALSFKGRRVVAFRKNLIEMAELFFLLFDPTMNRDSGL